MKKVTLTAASIALALGLVGCGEKQQAEIEELRKCWKSACKKCFVLFVKEDQSYWMIKRNSSIFCEMVAKSLGKERKRYCSM